MRWQLVQKEKGGKPGESEEVATCAERKRPQVFGKCSREIAIQEGQAQSMSWVIVVFQGANGEQGDVIERVKRETETTIARLAKDVRGTLGESAAISESVQSPRSELWLAKLDTSRRPFFVRRAKEKVRSPLREVT